MTDRVAVTLVLGPEAAAAVEAHRDWVAEQVLAVSMDVTTGDGGAPEVDVAVAGRDRPTQK